MIYLPFDLSIDFELRQAMSPAGVAAPQGGTAGGPGAAETRLSVSSAVGEQPASPQVVAGNGPCTYQLVYVEMCMGYKGKELGPVGSIL